MGAALVKGSLSAAKTDASKAAAAATAVVPKAPVSGDTVNPTSVDIVGSDVVHTDGSGGGGGEVDGGGSGARRAGAVASQVKREEEKEKPNGHFGVGSSTNCNGDAGPIYHPAGANRIGGVKVERLRGEDNAEDGERGRTSRAASTASASPTFAPAAVAIAGGGGGGGGGRPERLPLDPTSMHPAFAGRRPLPKHESPPSGRAYGLWDPASVHPVYFGHLRHDAEASGAAGLPGWTGAGDGGALDRGLRILRGAIDAGPAGAAAVAATAVKAADGRAGVERGEGASKAGEEKVAGGVARWSAEERATVLGLLCDEASMTGIFLNYIEVRLRPWANGCGHVGLGWVRLCWVGMGWIGYSCSCSCSFLGVFLVGYAMDARYFGRSVCEECDG